MDKTASLYCLPIERTSASSCWTSIPRCCCNCPQMSGNSNPREQNCNKNFLKCTPWRKKSLIRSTSRWTFLGLNSCLLRLLLLFWSLPNTVGSVFSGIISAKGIPRLRLWWILLIASLFGTILLPVVSSQESVQPKPSVKSKVLPNAVVYVGSVFSYNISEDVFDCNVNSIVVSETADRFLSHWLSYSSNKKQLYGVPSDKDKGTYNILVVALTKDTSLGGHVCGSQSFSIVVMSISEQLPVSVHLSTTGFSSNDHKPALGLSCPPGTQAILGTVVLNMDIQSLNGHQRMMLVVKIADHLSVDSSKLGFFSGEISNPITHQLDNPTVIAAGVGDGRFAKGTRSFITWNMACGALKLTDVGFSKLETAAQDGTISTLMGVPVVGWHVLSGTQKDMVRRRVRRQAQEIIAITPTPSASSTPPSRLSNMSTLVIVSKTVILTSASQNSTTVLPSVTPNRTVTKTTSVNINSTLFSQLTMKSIQSSTTGFNLTVSSLLVNKSMSSSSSIHLNLTESSQPPNKTAFASSSLIVTSSSVSIYPTTSIQLPNRTIFPSYSVSINLTTSSILPNRTIILSPSVSVSLTTSSQLLSATVFKSSSAVNINTSITSILTSSKLLLTVNSSSASRPTNIISANRTITISESHTPSLNSTFVTRTLSFILSASSPNKSTIVSSQNRSILSSLTMITLNTSQAVISSTIVPSASQGNISIAVRASSLTASFNRSTLVTSVSISSSFPSVLTTLQSTFPETSTAKLNSSIPNVSSSMLITQATASVTVVPSSFMPVANTSLLITSAASHTSLSTVISTTSSNLSSITSKSTFLASSSSLILLPPNTTLVENLTSSAKTSSFVTSSMVILPSTPQPGNSTESKAISPMPTSSLFTSLVSSTMNNTEISLVKTSSLVPSLSSTSSVMLSSSATQMSSPSMLLLSSTIVNQTSGVQIFSSSTLQPNLTSSKTAVLPSSMSSPIVTNASEVTSVNATTTKRTALVNSTFEINRSSFIAVTTSAFPLTRTSDTRSFPSTFVANRSVVPPITSKGFQKSSVNISFSPKITTTAFVFNTISPLSTSQFTSMFSSIDLRPNLTRITDSSFFSMSVKLTTSSEVPVNSTIASSTKGSPTAVSSAVTKSVDSTLSARRTTSSAMSVVTSSRHFNVNSSLMPSVLSSGKPIVGSSSTLMANLSSSVPVLDSSTAFSVVFTPADTSVMNLTTTEMSTTQISPTTLSSIPTSSSASSLLNSQDQTTLLSKSDVSESSRIVQNSTTLFGASRTVSMNFSSLSSTSSLRKSTTGIDSTMSRMSSAISVVTSTVVSLPSITVIPTSVTIPPTSATEILPSTTVIPTSATAIPTSVTDTLILSTHVTRGTRVVNSSSRLDSVFSRIPSSVQTSAAVTPTPVYRTTSILETSGSPSLASHNTTKKTLRSTEVIVNSSSTPSYSMVGSRMTTTKFSSAQINSTTVTQVNLTAVAHSYVTPVTQSNSTSVTRFSTLQSSTFVVTPSKFIGSSIKSRITFSDIVKTSSITQITTLKLIQSSKTSTRTPVITDSGIRITQSTVEIATSSRIPTFSSSRFESMAKKSSKTDSAASRIVSSVTSLMTSGVTLDRTSSVTRQTEFAVTTLVSKSSTRKSSVTDTAGSRIVSSVTSLMTSGVTLDRTSSVTLQTEFAVATLVSKSSSGTQKTSSARSIVNVTKSLDQSFVPPSRSMTSSTLRSSVLRGLTASIFTSILTSSTKFLTVVTKSTKLAATSSSLSSSLSSSTTTTTEKGALTSKPSLVAETSTPHRSFTLTTLKTVSSPSSLLDKSSVGSRIPALSPTAASFSSRKSGADNSSMSFSSFVSVKFLISYGTLVSTTSFSLSRAPTSFRENVSTVGNSQNLRSDSLVTQYLSTPINTNNIIDTPKQSSGSFHTSISQTVVLATIPLSSKLVPNSAVIFPRSSNHSGFSFHFSSILGPLPSSSSLSPSNSTQTATLPGTTRTISVSPSSTSVVIPTTAPPNSPPEVINNLGRVIAPAGVALHYTIPEDTFYDREDGADTRNLSLSMKLANGSSIPEDFWLQFDSESQTIDGLPLDTHVPDGIMGQVLVVYAQDSRGAEALDAFEVLVVPSENPVVQELNIRITNEFVEFSRNVAQRLLLLKKIASYYEDADESNIRVLSFKAGSVIMSWTNDSLPTERCDEEKLQYVANKILLSNGEVRTEFREALKGFPLVSANEERMGVCNGSYPVITNAPIDAGARTSSEEGDLWYKHVLVGVLIVLVLIVLAVLLIWYCRRRRPKPSNEKRTFKKRKPIILEPEIELKPIPGKPLVLPDDSPSFPPSYISETSLDKPVSSDEDDEEDYGKGSPGVRYEPPPPFYGVLDDEDPRNTPPPAYQLPPMF